MYKFELHLLIRKKLAKLSVLEKIHKQEAPLIRFDKESIMLHLLFNLGHYVHKKVLVRLQTYFILLILVSLEDIDHF